MVPFRTLDDLSTPQRVLVRVDLNAPIEDRQVQDTRRFERHARTIRELAEAGHRVVCLAHQGRPGGEDFVSLDQHADILAAHVDRPVGFVPDTFGEDAISAIRALSDGDICLLENVRTCEDELPEADPAEKAETAFVRTLAEEVDAYVNDAYSAAHRSHASLVGFPLVLPAYAGRVMETEYEANTAIARRTFDGQVTMAVGGVKATDVIDVMDNLGDTVDRFLLGGVAGQLFLRAAGHPVGFDTDPQRDLFDSQWAANRDLVESMLADHRDRIALPVDLAYEVDGDRAERPLDALTESDTAYLDVGTDTARQYADVVRDSEAVFLKGALGVFEDERFATGTVTVLEAIAETDCFSVVGGGDTARAIEMYGLDEADFDHVSIAGGAYIRALTGDELVGVDVLL